MPRIFSLALPRAISLTACFMGALVCGCATKPVPPAADESPGVHMALVSAMQRADAQKTEVASAQNTADFSQRTMTVIWEGEGAEILRRIAAAQHINFKITGPQPRLQLPVFVHLKNVGLKEAIEAIAEQFGDRANVYLGDDVIELRMRLY